jgi:outer membrane protein assembly factor BamB
MAFVIGLSTFAGSDITRAADWPNWRGPDYNGISAETGWSADKIKEGTEPLWETNIGTAFSSVVISNGRLYTMGNDGALELAEEEEEEEDEDEAEEDDVEGEESDEEEEDEDDEDEPEYYTRDYDAEAVTMGQSDIVYCLDAETGKVIWTYSYPALLEGRDYQGGPNATPTVDGEKVYTLSKRGKVFCFNAKTGKVVWRKDLRKEFGVRTPYWGLASSPVIIDDMVICNAGSYGLALDKNDGSLRWQNGKGPAGYSSAVPFSIGNRKCIAMLVHRELVGLVAATGKILWQEKWETLYDENIPDVIISGKKLFASTGLGTGSAFFKFDDSNLTKIWSHKKLQNHMNSSVLWDGYIYGIDGAKLVCLDFETGRVAWSKKGAGKYGSSITLSDGKLIILTEKGKLIIAEASPKSFKEIASAQILSGRCWTVPVLANGKIYARGNATGRLVCLDVSGN